MKFISFFDGQLLINAELVYEISIEEVFKDDTCEYYFELLMEDKHHKNSNVYEVFVRSNNWHEFEEYMTNFWEDMKNTNVIKVVPRL